MKWVEKEHGLEKEFTFETFSEALAFVNDVGALAERENHHPDIFLHDYRFVHLILKTHAVGSVTDRDRHLAGLIEQLVKKTHPS